MSSLDTKLVNELVKLGVPKDKAETIVKNLSEVDRSKALKDAAFLQDICKTPTSPGPIPIPYPNTAMASDTTSGSKSVKISGKEVMLKNKSYYEKSTGDEAGTSSSIDGIEIENVVKQLRSGLEQLYVNIDDAINGNESLQVLSKKIFGIPLWVWGLTGLLLLSLLGSRPLKPEIWD
jgi:hypothetical protein